MWRCGRKSRGEKLTRSRKRVFAVVRTGAWPRLVCSLLLRPNARGEPSLLREDGGVERDEFGALLDLLAALAAEADLGVRLANLQGEMD